MAIPKPTITWDSYFDFNEASVVLPVKFPCSSCCRDRWESVTVSDFNLQSQMVFCSRDIHRRGP
jgi:hypothetical protein